MEHLKSVSLAANNNPVTGEAVVTLEIMCFLLKAFQVRHFSSSKLLKTDSFFWEMPHLLCKITEVTLFEGLNEATFARTSRRCIILFISFSSSVLNFLKSDSNSPSWKNTEETEPWEAAETQEENISGSWTAQTKVHTVLVLSEMDKCVFIWSTGF